MKPRITVVVITFALAAVSLAAARQPPSEFDKSLTEACLALDLGRFDEAEELFEKLAAAYPDRRPQISLDRAWVSMEKGYRALQADNYAEADRLLSLAVEVHSGLADSFPTMRAYARMWAISPALDAAYDNPRTADWASAERHLRELIAIDTSDVWAHYRLGGVLERRGKKDEAAREYRTAVGKGKGPAGGGAKALDSLRAAADKAADAYKFKYDKPAHPVLSRIDHPDMKKYEAAPFIIYSHSEELARRAAAVLKFSLSQEVLGGLLKARTDLPQTVLVHIYRDRAAYGKATNNKNSGGAALVDKEYEGKGARAVDTFQDNPNLFASTLPHELGHIRCYTDLGDAGTNLLSWIAEGIAENAAHGPAGSDVALELEKARKAGTLLSGERLLSVFSGDPRMVHLVYPQGQVLTGVLVEKYGKDKLSKLINEIGGRRIIGSWSLETISETTKKVSIEKFKEVYGLTPADAEKLMLDWIAANLPEDSQAE